MTTIFSQVQTNLFFRKQVIFSLFLLTIFSLACRASATNTPAPTATVQVAQFSTAEPTASPTASPDLTYLLTPEPTATETPHPTDTPAPVVDTPSAATNTPLPPPTETPAPLPTNTPAPAPTEVSMADVEPAAETLAVDFVLRHVRMRSNEENSWDGKLGDFCGSDHSIYVYTVDTQENLLDGVLVGDKYGNFEVPTGVDGPGMVRILVWSATMEVAVMGHQDGTRFTGDFSPLLSTVDEDISPDWLQQGGYCQSLEDCQQRAATNQLCRGHYSYDVIFQRTW